MHDLQALLKQTRARIVLEDIAQGTKKLMPCGEQRIASLLKRFGAVLLVEKDSRFTTSYIITPLGEKNL